GRWHGGLGKTPGRAPGAPPGQRWPLGARLGGPWSSGTLAWEGWTAPTFVPGRAAPARAEAAARVGYIRWLARAVLAPFANVVLRGRQPRGVNLDAPAGPLRDANHSVPHFQGRAEKALLPGIVGRRLDRK